MAFDIDRVWSRGQFQTEDSEMKLRLFVWFAAAALTGMVWAGTVPNECGMALQACKQKNNCGKTPNSNECQACQKAYKSCWDRSQKPKAPTVPGAKKGA